MSWCVYLTSQLLKSIDYRQKKMSSRSQFGVQECEDYVEQHGIQSILKECIAKICQERPDKPYRWLKEYFEKLDKVSFVRFTVRQFLTEVTERVVNVLLDL